MKGHSLISLVQLCNAGCVVYIDGDKLSIGFNGQHVMEAIRCPRTGLWLLPLNNQGPIPPDGTAETAAVAANVYHTSTRAEWIQYLHQACFSPNVETWCKAIDNDQFLGWPGLDSKSVRRHLPPSTATAKGHMARNQKNV